MSKAIQIIVDEENQNLLDGSPQIGGKGREGNTYTDYLMAQYKEFLPYLSIEDLVIYDEGLSYYKWETPRDRAMKVLAWTAVLEKIPEAVMNEYYTRVEDAFNIKMNQLRNARKKHSSYELGAREFTLTYSPKWFSDDEARKQMQRAINRLIKYYKNGDQRIIRLRAIGEVGSNGLSHVHCFYQLMGGVKITDKNFKRAYPPWDTRVKQGPTGHKGGHHANVKHQSDFLGYIDKQVADAWLDISIDAEDPTA